MTNETVAEQLEDEWIDKWFEYVKNLPKNDWISISHNPNLKYKHIAKNPDEAWVWECIVAHQNLTLDDLVKLKNQIPELRSRIATYTENSCICENPNMTMEMAKNKFYPFFDNDVDENDAFQNYSCHIFHNKHVTLDDIKIELNAKRKMCCNCAKHFSSSSNITYEIVKNNPDIPWCWRGISMNPNITMDIIEDNPNEKWEWNHFDDNPNLTMDMVLNNPYEEWYWCYVCAHPNITMDMLETCKMNKNPIQLWNLRGIAQNPNVTIDYLVKLGKKYNMVDDWFHADICINPLTLQKQNYITNHIKFILLVSIHEYYLTPETCSPFDNYKKVEYVFADNFLVSRIVKY
jgi:hypothetical protein